MFLWKNFKCSLVFKSIVWFAKNHWSEFHTPNPYQPYHSWKKWDPPNMVVNLDEKTPFSKLLTTAQNPTMSLQFKAQGPKVPCQTWNYHMRPHPRERVLSPIRRALCEILVEQSWVQLSNWENWKPAAIIWLLRQVGAWSLVNHCKMATVRQ